MGTGEETSIDLATFVLAPVGRLLCTEDGWVPYRLVDADGVSVEAVSAFFAELQAAGRTPATLRSYGMDLLRWFRFCWPTRSKVAPCTTRRMTSGGCSSPTPS